MASIDKLLIKGIRSFDPDQGAVIRFYKPLTLIVGQNGAGKTTIIEALKYATTGDLPPNSKGGAFIHDPKVIKRNEVTAQVQLRFTNTNETPVECHRSIQLIQNKSKSTVKTLDSVLYTFDPVDNERKSVTLRAGDLADEMVQNLGVSKAILDYVIFCHQEESNWPLSDSSSLKKKFDEIFASAEYTKLLEHMVKTEKSLINEAKDLRNNVKLIEKDLDSAKKIKQEIIDIEEQIQEGNIKVELINTKLEKVNSDVESLEEKTTRLISIENDIKMFQTEYNKLVKAIEEIKSSFTELYMSDQELLIKQDESERKMAGLKERKNLLNTKKLELESKYNSIQNELREERFRQGQLKSSFEQYESHKKEFVEVLKQLAPRLNESSQSLSQDLFDDEAAKLCFSHLKEQIQIERTSIDKIKSESRGVKSNLSEEIQQLRIEENNYQKGLAVLENKQKILNQRLDSSKHQLKQIENSKSTFEKLDLELEEKRRAYEVLNTEYLGEDLSEKIATKARELSECEQLLNLASQKVESSIPAVDTKLLLDLKREQQREIKNRTDRLILANKKLFEKYLKHVPLPQSISLQVQNTLNVRRNDFKEASLQHADILSSLSKAEGRFSLLQSIVSKKQTESIDLQTQVQSICGSQSLAAALSHSETILKEKERLLNHTKGALAVYNELLERTLSSNPGVGGPKKRLKTSAACDVGHSSSCPLCEMAFDTKISTENLISSLSDKKHGYEDKIRTLNTEYERDLSKFNNLKRSSVLWDRFERLRNIEIPYLEAEQRTFAESAIKFRQESSDKLIEIETIKLSMGDLEKLIRPASEISILDTQSRQLLEEISHLDKNCDGSSQSSIQSETIQYISQCAVLREELKALESAQKEALHNLSRKQAEIDRCQVALEKERSNIEEVSRLQLLISEIETDLSNDLQKIEGLKTEISELSSKIQNKKVKLNQLQQNEDEFLLDRQKNLDNLNEKRSRLSLIEESILKHEKENLLFELSKVVNSVNQKESGLQSLEDRLKKLSSELEECTKEDQDLKRMHQNILTNIQYCQLKHDLGLKEAERSVLEQQYINNDCEKFKNELKRKLDRQAGLRDQRATILGELSQLDKNKSTKARELRINYKDVDNLARCQKQAEQAHLQKIEDLSKYNKLLDTMIMKFHSLKMAEINKIIQELWANTYFGSDINTIRIKSDAEKQAGRGTYNYRVVMVKNNVELDMRGRCSAGQKVLSSIIIRLALAEAFGADCGVLALDEPTTNLDRDNISSLARSLVSIIKSRSNQKNFQLVIITHDEAFTSELGHSEFTEYYWALSKQNGQSSRIKRNLIADLF